MSLLSEMQADMAAAIADYEQTFEWLGTDYACVRRTSPTIQEQMDGGWVDGVRFSLVVVKTLFAEAALEDGSPEGLESGDPVGLEGPYPQIGDLLNNGADQIKSIMGATDPATPALILYAGNPDAA